MKRLNIERIKEVKKKDDLRREKNKTVGGACLKHPIHQTFCFGGNNEER